MGRYEDLVRETVEAVLAPGRPVSLPLIARAVGPRLPRLVTGDDVEVVVQLVIVVLRADPRFIEVAPGVWARRGDGPEAGVPSRRRPPPFAGSAAAEVRPPEPLISVDAVGGDAKISPQAL